ncbi:unnamed protein product [Prorocentrum cordatum]|uniref:Uncharacterized protein n=1 Tax=Prorocentrum cordatum TaxID=2364126 RepID=A0ABN9WPU2_9DINO|nr:unnamed protein product [Polarella glacialis]
MRQQRLARSGSAAPRPPLQSRAAKGHSCPAGVTPACSPGRAHRLDIQPRGGAARARTPHEAAVLPRHGPQRLPGGAPGAAPRGGRTTVPGRAVVHLAHAQHAQRLSGLEAALSRHLGRRFAFDARTAIRDDHTPELRLRCIADFAAEHCRKGPVSVKRLRMLVLDDFHVTPFGTWHCGSKKMDSARAVEKYLVSRVPNHVDAQVRLIHTYDEWTTDTGLGVQIGCGLTSRHFNQAVDFLVADSVSGNAGVLYVPAHGRKDGGKMVTDKRATTRKAKPPKDSPEWVRRSEAFVRAFVHTGLRWVP